MSKLNWITPLAVAIIIGGFVLGSLLGTPGHFGLAKQLADQSIRIGHPVSPFRAIDSRGRVSDILADVSGRPAFVYVYTPACRWCRANLANLRAVARAISATRRVVFVSRDAAVSPEYAAILPTAEMYKSPTQDTISAFDLDGVPRTFVISPDRVLAGHWRGAYIGPNQTEIERFFRISLPGLDNSSIETAR